MCALKINERENRELMHNLNDDFQCIDIIRGGSDYTTNIHRRLSSTTTPNRPKRQH